VIDLHVHSTFSDGSLTPTQLVERARTVGLKAMALTDHDSMSGLDEFLSACREAEGGPIGIPGVEISADVPHGTLHMLGYFMDAHNQAMAGMLRDIREGRRIRNEKILTKLNEMGLQLSWDEVNAFASHCGDDVVGRPHFAQAMVARGFVSSHEEAFERYLAKGQPAYTDRFRLSPEESLKIIRGAGGVPVLAHPSTLKLSNGALRTLVKDLAALGLQGIEVYYSEHSPRQIQQYLSLAREYALVATGGSDFHGGLNPAIELGRGFGSLNVPDEVADELQRRRG